jgi:hypothetical protein
MTEQQKEKEKENLCLKCPICKGSLPESESNWENMRQHIYNFHILTDEGYQVATELAIMISKSIKKDKIEALIKKYSNYIGQEHYKITVKILLDLKALLGDSKE